MVKCVEYGTYKIYSNGKIFNKFGREVKPIKRKDGYYNVGLSINGKIKMYVYHRLLAMLFVPNPEGYEIVHHIDGNKRNNKISNLRWTDRSGNAREYIISSGRCMRIANNKGDTYYSVREAARNTGLSDTHIRYCIENERPDKNGVYWCKLDEESYN